MGIFGWSLPPGCSELPGERASDQCDVCRLRVDLCCCRECPVCGEVGDAKCYTEHGMQLDDEQLGAIANAEADAAGRIEYGLYPDIPDCSDAPEMAPVLITGQTEAIHAEGN